MHVVQESLAMAFIFCVMFFVTEIIDRRF